MARTRSYYRNQMATVAWLHGAGNQYGGRDAGGDVSVQNQIISYELGPGGLANVAAETCPRSGGGEDGRGLDLVVAERVVRRPVVIEIDSDTESDSDKGLESDHDSDLNLEFPRTWLFPKWESWQFPKWEMPVSPRVVVRPTSAAPLRLPRALSAVASPCSGCFPRAMAAPEAPAQFDEINLRVWSGEQDRVVMASPIVTTSVVVNKVMGTFMLPIMQQDDHPSVFLIRLPNPADCGENVFFTRVLRVVHTDARDVFINMEVHQVY
ncbi:hypothetical protein HU200_013567 [Digitaria exilis]|uniref:Uncharacterized protein n=1 Tax=Digitaria exilis TaxID=1010633 RepID=A0A835FED5_9POAL|nr:hypothetical protein HU200_013567 [Digitaria exilis]